MSAYGHPPHKKALRDGFEAAGKKLDMGKACIRFKKLDDLPLEVIGKAIARAPIKEFVSHYESFMQESGRRKKKARARK